MIGPSVQAMTERIDLDDLAGGEDEDEDEAETGAARGNDADWLWREEDQSTPDPGDGTDTPTAGTDVTADGRVPRIPRENVDRPAGLPESSGGAGGGAVDLNLTSSSGPETSDPSSQPARAGGDEHASPEAATEAAEMTTVFTYEALSAVADPVVVVAQTRGWSDFVGVVGDVSMPVINQFLREHELDVDFFNGTGTGPAERLREVTPESMFFAERMVVVGRPGENWIAEEADWEFVPLADAAEKAGWER